MCAATVEASVELLGASPQFEALRSRLPAISRAQRTTLISGPTGAGKDVVARVLHAGSSRRAQPFVAVHCAALPDALVEAEMFGHARGAFTGATHARPGLIRSAAGGTLFLDEVDSLPAGAQAKLLRFLESGEYRAVGTDHVEHSDAWVLAATNQNLEDRVARGLFRADLMYRLAVVSVQVPALAERPDDILTLAHHFLVQITGGAKQFDESARAALLAYAWPGNVRELRHRVETAALLDESDTIDRQALGLPQASSPLPMQQDPRGLEVDLWSLITRDGLTLSEAIARCEQLMIRAALRAEGNNRTKAAGRLGIHVRTIFKKLP
ncbi:MAG: sigma-54 dependent transcriptional regulator [Kofleriaceae bacterium]